MKIDFKKWTIAFLGLTGVVVGMELFAAYFDTGAMPWTFYISNYIPSWIGLPLIFGFSVWLCRHFIKAYEETKK